MYITAVAWLIAMTVVIITIGVYLYRMFGETAGVTAFIIGLGLFLLGGVLLIRS
jgi:hypothetical protein